MSENKECFFITPIGEDGSEVRDRSDKLMEYVIEEAVSDYGYSVTRADRMDQPGSITSQVIQKTVESDLVIADLTGHNPNVFYELAVRHATGEPCIQLIESTDTIPFDISDLRTVKYGLGVQEADQARESIRSQLESLNDEDTEFDNPISRSAEMKSLRESTDPSDQNLAEVLEQLSRLETKMNKLEHDMMASEKTTLEDVNTKEIKTVKIDGEEYRISGSANIHMIEKIAEKEDITKKDVIESLKRNNISIK